MSNCLLWTVWHLIVLSSLLVAMGTVRSSVLCLFGMSFLCGLPPRTFSMSFLSLGSMGLFGLGSMGLGGLWLFGLGSLGFLCFGGFGLGDLWFRGLGLGNSLGGSLCGSLGSSFSSRFGSGSGLLGCGSSRRRSTADALIGIDLSRGIDAFTVWACNCSPASRRSIIALAKEIFKGGDAQL